MTLKGAIKQLHELRCAEDMPIYYKPAIAEVINVLLMDAQEVRHGLWLKNGDRYCECSECHHEGNISGADNYCWFCGANMNVPTQKSIGNALEALDEVEEVRHGEWVIDRDEMVMHCDSCSWVYEYYDGLEEEWNYCPHCGADERGGK